MAIEADIRKAIEANLSAEVGGVLKARLEQADKDSHEVENLRKRCITLDGIIEDKNSHLQKHTDIAVREKALADREASVTKRELAAQLNEFKVEAANDKCKAVFDLASLAFRNPKFVHSESHNTNRQIPDQYGGTRSVCDTGSKTVTSEQQ